MKKISKNFIWGILTLLIAVFIFSSFYSTSKAPAQISLDQLAQKINNGEVSKIVINNNDLNITLKNGENDIAKKETETGLAETLKNFGVNTAALQKVYFEIQEESGIKYWLSIIIPSVLPLIVIGIFFWLMFRQAKSGVGQAFSFGKANIKIFTQFKDRVTFNDVAGLKEVKQELIEVVDFLKNPKKYLEIGAKIPRGVLLYGAPGTGKCITGESLVLTNKGLLPIADIPKYFVVEGDRVSGAKIISFNQNEQEFEWQEPSHWYNLGESKTIKIKTQLGTAIEGTPEHPLIVLDKESGNLEFKKLEDIKEEDLLLISYNHQAFGNYKKVLDTDTAYLMGLLIGDGGLTTKGRITFTSADKELVEKFKEVVKSKWNYSPISKGKYDYQICDSKIKSDLIKYGLQEVYSENKIIPESILLAPKEVITAFLRGIFDTDGYCDGKKNNVIELSSASKNLIQTIHHLLMNMGIVNKIYERKKIYNGKMQNYISISGDFLSAFRNEIGFGLTRKRLALESALEKSRNTNNNLIYCQQSNFKNLWLTIKTTGFLADHRFYKKTFYKNITRYIRGERNPSVSSAVQVLDFAKTINPSIARLTSFKKIENFCNLKHFFSPVTEIKKGRAEVFDFTVPVNHSFIANSLVNHNTLLARAVAGEANVPFFHISGSEFVELFVGIGASRVRDLFDTAKKSGRAIIFIDEIDAVGRERGAGLGGGHDEREQTLNQILVEMDGFEKNDGRIVIAATNRPDVLDPALLRPGRFDRRILLDLPDINDREEILKIHAQEKVLAKDLNLRKIAERTPGFSGADLANLLNEAALFAARKNQKEISQQDIFDSVEKILLGPERRSRIFSKKEKERTAFHEAGHALVAASLENADPVHKVSIVARGRAGGYTLKLPTEETYLRTKSQFMADLATMLGGYLAEQIVFSDVSTGASNDLQNSSDLTRKLVTKYGMSDKLGPITFGKTEEMIFLGREISTEKNYSEEMAKQIDEEVKNFISQAYLSAKKIISSRRKVLEAIAKTLIEKETIEQEEFNQIIKGFNLKKI